MEELYTKQNQALNVLIEAIKFAQAKGAYTIEQAAVIASAIKAFQVEENEEQPSENLDSSK
jgi:hypothetical protein